MKKIKRKIRRIPIPTSPPIGNAYFLTFPFWIFIDRNNTLTVQEIQLENLPLRIHPPFRSAPANYIPMPRVNPHSIPSIGKQNNYPKAFDMSISAVPLLEGALSEGKAFEFFQTPIFDNELPAFPMDSMRIDMLSINRDEKVIRETFREFINYIRFRTRQWWIGRSMDFIMGFIRNSAPFTESDTLIEPSQCMLQVSTINGDELPVNGDLWLAVIKDMVNKTEVPAFHYMILDAYYYAYTDDIKSAIINAATACEQAKDLTFERLWKLKGNDNFKRGKVLRNYDLPDHISQDLEAFGGYSYSKSFPDEFNQIEDLWNARGNIAHGGPNMFWRDRKQIYIDRQLGIQLVKASDHCIKWLQSIGQLS